MVVFVVSTLGKTYASQAPYIELHSHSTKPYIVQQQCILCLQSACKVGRCSHNQIFLFNNTTPLHNNEFCYYGMLSSCRTIRFLYSVSPEYMVRSKPNGFFTLNPAKYCICMVNKQYMFTKQCILDIQTAHNVGSCLHN